MFGETGVVSRNVYFLDRPGVGINQFRAALWFHQRRAICRQGQVQAVAIGFHFPQATLGRGLGCACEPFLKDETGVEHGSKVSFTFPLLVPNLCRGLLPV